MRWINYRIELVKEIKLGRDELIVYREYYDIKSLK